MRPLQAVVGLQKEKMMSMDAVAREWLAARKIIGNSAIEAGIKVADANRFAEAVIARLAHHDPPILLDMDVPCECGFRDKVCGECGTTR